MTSMDQLPDAARDASSTTTDAGTSAAEPAEPDQLLYPRPGILAGNRYRLVERIGRGASAEVWGGWDERLSRPVAVKIFRDSTEGDPAARARRSGEARLLASLSHQHLVAIYDAAGFGSEHEVSWMAMELVDGQTLRDIIAAGPLPAPAVAAIGRQLADALDYVHRRGAIHRDVKPANVLLASSPRDGAEGLDAEAEPFVKLTDFGVARLLDDTHLTLEGFTIGTANYLSPEQVTGNACGPAVDVYALGLVLLEALTGTMAYPGIGAEAALVRLHRPPHILDSLPAQWRSLLTAMTARAPAARPALPAVRAALASLAADSPIVPADLGSPDSYSGWQSASQSGLDDLFPTDLVPLAWAGAGHEGTNTGGARKLTSTGLAEPRRRRLGALLLAAAAAVIAAIATPLAFVGSANPSEAAAATAPSQHTTRKTAPGGSENAGRSHPSSRSARLVPTADIRDMRVTRARHHRAHVVSAHRSQPAKRAAAPHRRHRADVQHRVVHRRRKGMPARHAAPARHAPAPPRSAPGPHERPAPHKPAPPKAPKPKPHDKHGPQHREPKPHDPTKPLRH